jgi:single-strand DNA-binding protein
MSRGLNKVLIIGQLGRDPEMRYTPSGHPVTTFNVGAHRSRNTSDGERRKEIEWFNIVAWSSLTEICKRYLSNGSPVFIKGRLHTRRCEDHEGVRHYATRIVTNEMIMLDKLPKKNPFEASFKINSNNEYEN